MSSAAPTPLPPGRLYIGGEWSGAASGRTYPTENPATEEVLTEASIVIRDDEEQEVEKFREFLDQVNPEDFA